MYLKRLEMYGFKSFADKTVLDFMPGVTTVIGPNGSGKSNISDCIRWILGEQSMKSLRGAKSEDIIFAGTQNRKSLGFAEASLVFDNQDGKLPIEYTEVTITRRIYRSGESGYYINKAPCRLKDILELFMDTGIGKDGYSIIGQGKIDEILSNKSEDRRNIFEEAAGIVKYKNRKIESEKKLEQTKLNLLRINDIVAEIEGNIEPLKLQSEKARKFLDLREELKNVEIGLFLYNIDDYKLKVEEIIKNIDVFETQKVKEEERLQNIQLEKEALKENFDKLLEVIEETQKLAFESTNKKEQLNSEIGICIERISNNKENFERLDNEISALNDLNKELENESKQKIEKRDRLVNNKDKFEKELKEKEQELEKFSKNMSEKELEIENKKKIVQENTDNKYEYVAQINGEKANKENLLKRENSIKKEIQETISEADSQRNLKSDKSKDFYTVEAKRNELLKKVDTLKSETAERDIKIQEYNEQINKLQNEYRMKETRHKFLVETEREKEGYARSVKELLLATEKVPDLKKGMHGVLANLISVKDEYGTAIEMTLGSSIQNIVTDTEETAKKLVNYLRANNLGRASFLPITSIKGQKLTKINTKGINGYIGIAADLISFDKKYEQIIFNLLGRTVIVDNIDTAVAISKLNSYTFKVVTLEGDVINPSGSITGGSVAKKTVNLLGRGNEIKQLETELKKLKEKIEKLEEEKEKYTANVKDLFEEFEVSQKSLQEFEITYATEKQKIDNIDLEILKLEAKLSKLREDDLEQIKKEKLESENNKKDLEEKVSKIDKENEELTKIIEEFSENNKDTQKYIDDLNFDITNLKISVSSFDESEMSLAEMLERINNDIKNNLNSINLKKELKDKIVNNNKELEAKIEDVKKQIENLQNEVLHSDDKIESLKAERETKKAKISKFEQDILELQNIIDDVKNQISKQEIKKSKYELELEQIINKMWEEYELTPNNVSEYKKAENPQEVQKNVNSLRTEIKNLGSINVDSIKEYKELKERYDFISEQRLDLENASNKLKKVIEDMTTTMKNQFETQFKIINKNFSETFTELFGGGKAELILEDKNNILECGIDIQVQPPGKKLQNMLLLSGGERAFTAIALLFAILKINPSPFCVLDEIEAALDDVNVYRFAEYLKKFSNEVQFLVITHRKGTMEIADTVYGITMEEKGISKLLSMKMS